MNMNNIPLVRRNVMRQSEISMVMFYQSKDEENLRKVMMLMLLCSEAAV